MDRYKEFVEKLNGYLNQKPKPLWGDLVKAIKSEQDLLKGDNKGYAPMDSVYKQGDRIQLMIDMTYDEGKFISGKQFIKQTGTVEMKKASTKKKAEKQEQQKQLIETTAKVENQITVGESGWD